MVGKRSHWTQQGPYVPRGLFWKGCIPTTGCPPWYSHLQQRSPSGQRFPVLTSCVTRLPIRIGGGVGTEELFTCQAPELALSTWLASLRLAEEDGHLLTRLVPLQCHPHPRGELLCKGREDPKVLAPDLCHLPPVVPAPSSPGSPNLGWHLWDTACGGSGRKGWQEVVPGLTSLC